MKRLTPEQEAVRNEHPVDLPTLQRELGERVLEIAMADYRAQMLYEQGTGPSPEALALEQEGPLAVYIDNYGYKNYRRPEIVEAFERFNITKLDTGTVENMRQNERKLLAEHLVHFTHSLEHRGKVLATPGADIESRFADYQFHSDEEAIEYGHELLRFTHDLQELHGYKLLEDTIGYRDSTVNFAKLGKKVRAYNDKHGKFEVPYDTQDHRLILWHEQKPRPVKTAA